jgi:hypothetical protein
MKESALDLERTIIADDQAPGVAHPDDGALDDPAAFVTTQRPAILRGWTRPRNPYGETLAAPQEDARLPRATLCS